MATLENEAQSHDDANTLNKTRTWKINPPKDVPSEAWEKRNILSLDGGGIRGYWTLLVLEQLMEKIARIEENLDKSHASHHSFYPRPWPDNVSQIPLNKEQEEAMGRAPDGEKVCVLDKALRYLPCHYFDHICGSSTGALIAIMLGRLRMTVLDCKQEYENLGQEIFGRPRRVHSQKIPLGNRFKYNAEKLEIVFKRLAIQRNDLSAGKFDRICFPSGKGMCSTLVTSRKRGIGGVLDESYLIRSYNHKDRARSGKSVVGSPANSRQGTGLEDSGYHEKRTDSSMVYVNYENAQSFEIWQVARAATAAEFFFAPLKIKIERTWPEEYEEFTDGGFEESNNPSTDAKTDISKLHGDASIGIFVSVGTARKRPSQPLKENGKKHFFTAGKHFFVHTMEKATDPEKGHKDMKRDKEITKYPFEYIRLNKPDGCLVPLDEWEPKQSKSAEKRSGHETLKKIRDSFSNWCMTSDTQDTLNFCAEKLVASRRRRMHTRQWERFATGAEYECLETSCNFETFDGLDFRHHLQEHHKIKPEALESKSARCKEHWRYPPAPKRVVK